MDQLTIIVDQIRTIRKPQTCSDCGVRYLPGRKMRYVFCRDSEGTGSFYYCMSCTKTWESPRSGVHVI